MKKPIHVVSLLVTILMAAFVAPALAKNPDVVTEEDFAEFFTDCSQFGEDLDFTVRHEEFNDVRITTFYNKDDSVNRTQIKFHFSGTITNLETGTSFRDVSNPISITIYPSSPADEVHARGVSVHLTYPGLGVVALRVGKIIFNGNLSDVRFVAGKNFDKTFEQVVCEGINGL